MRIPVCRGSQEFLKVGTRNAMVIAVASVALVVDVDARTVRCALGSVGPTIIRATEAEEWVGERIDWDTPRVESPAVLDEFATPRCRGRASDRRPPFAGRLPASRGEGHGAPRAGAGDARGGGVVTPTADYRLRVNGREHVVDGAWIGESLLYVLRERLGLPGAKNACEQGECGSCSVLVDGVLTCACLVLAASATGAEIGTIEGVCPDGGLSDVQRAFLDAGAVQCGFCTPGLVVAVHDLLESTPDPSDLELREALSGNLCRCTGYGRIFQAVRDVVAARAPARLAGERRCLTATARARSPARRRARGREWASRPRVPTAGRRSRAGSRSRPTCSPKGCCGAPRCGRRIRRRASGASTSGPRCGSAACRRC